MGTRWDSRWTGRNLVHCAIQSFFPSPLPVHLSSLYLPSHPTRFQGGEEYIPSNLPGLCIRRQIERYWGKEFPSSSLLSLLSSFFPVFPASFFLNVLFYFSFHANEREADFLWPYTQVNRYYHQRTLIPLVSNEPW